MLLTILQQLPEAPIPASGYVLCFGPLAFVILGFIAAAVVSDRHARRAYLRFTPSDEAPGVHIDAHKLPNAPLPSDTTITNYDYPVVAPQLPNAPAPVPTPPRPNVPPRTNR